MKWRFLTKVLVCLILLDGWSVMRAEPNPRLNEIQVIGTHNSYHLAPEPPTMRLIEQGGAGWAASVDYSHRPLWEQFAILGIRQIELDVFADPDGGHYARPKSRALVQAANLGPLQAHDPEGHLRQPGLKVLHVADFDYRTTVYTFKDALGQIKSWSDQNPGHVPIMVLVEVKEGLDTLGMTPPIAFGLSELEGVDREIRSVFPRTRLVLPDDIRGQEESLREALRMRGWPRLSEVRGKIIFALDNGGEPRDLYLEGHESLEGRVLFVSVDADHPAAGFMKINDPIRDFDRIQEAVRAGFLVRTRADTPTDHARNNDTVQRDRALASGAQFVSTDYREPDPRLSPYRVELPGALVARGNPLAGKAGGIEFDGVSGWRSLMPASESNPWTNPFDWGEVDVPEGEIHLRSDRNFMIATTRTFRDFVFEVEAQVPSGNSGVFFRCRRGEKKLLGYQAEIDLSDRHYSGGVYDNTGRGFLVPQLGDEASLSAFRGRQGEGFRPGQWNRIRIECFGDRIRVAVNGRWASDFRDQAHREGVIGLQHHGGPVVYRFRRARILEL